MNNKYTLNVPTTNYPLDWLQNAQLVFSGKDKMPLLSNPEVCHKDLLALEEIHVKWKQNNKFIGQSNIDILSIHVSL